MGANTNIYVYEELVNLAEWIVVLGNTFALLLMIEHEALAGFRRRWPLVRVSRGLLLVQFFGSGFFDI